MPLPSLPSNAPEEPRNFVVNTKFLEPRWWDVDDEASVGEWLAGESGRSACLRSTYNGMDAITPVGVPH